MADLTEAVVNLAKRRGFVFPSSEIYGGFRSTWDYGPLGVLLKRNVMEAWWRAMVQERDDIVGLEFFVPPDEGQKWFEYWCEERLRWYVDLGIPAEKLRLRHHDPEELSHYSTGTADVEFDYPWGWGELEGVANRTNYDLTQHAK